MTPEPDGDDDAHLIGSADPNEFAGIFDRHAATLLGYLTRRVGRSDAEDLLGDLFRIAFESRHRYDPMRPNARPWLYGIAANLVLKHHRSNSRGQAAQRRLNHQDRPTAVPFDERIVDEMVNAQRALQLTDLVEQLAPDDRETIVLYAWENLSYQQIAEALEVPVGTVRSRLNRVRRRLRELAPPTGKEIDELKPRAEEGTCR